MTEDPSDNWHPKAVRALQTLVALGVAFRLIRFIANRSLWLDEAYLAESILTRTLRQLTTEPLMHWQAAPVGYLWLEKLAATVFGTSEPSLRLVSLIAGLAAVFFFAAIVRRVFGSVGGLAATLLFIGVEPLVYYSAEVKQYSSDVTVAVALIWAVLRVLDRPRSLGRIAFLATVGAIGIFLSHPAIFVIAGLGIVLFMKFLIDRDTKAATAISAVGMIWLGLFAVNYVVFLRPLVQHEGLTTYWADAYMPWDRTAIIWFGRSIHQIFANYSTMWMPLPDVALMSSAVGAVWLWRRDRKLLGMSVLPVLLALIAAMLHRFPFSGRLILFVVPFAILLIGAGAQALWDATAVGRRAVPVVVMLILLGPTTGRSLFYAVLPPGREEMRPLLAYLGEQRKPGDLLYVFNISQQPYRYYQDRFGVGPDRFQISDLKWMAGKQIEPTEFAFTEELKPLSGEPRVWVLLSHFAALGGPDERQIIPPVLDRMGKRLDDRTATGARLMLYDLSASASTVLASAPPPPR